MLVLLVLLVLLLLLLLMLLLLLLLVLLLLVLPVLPAGGSNSQRCRIHTGCVLHGPHVSGCRQRARCTCPKTQQGGVG